MAVRLLVEAFQEENPDVRVIVQQIPWSAAHEKLLTAYAGDAMPDVFAVGNTLANAPRHNGALWTTYEIPSGTLRGMGVGAGISAVSLRYGESGDSFLLPGYMRTEATAFYKLARDKFDWRFSVNIKNALDRGYYESGTTTQIRPGAPLTAYLAVKVTRH